MTAKFDLFKAELYALCEKHGVMIWPSKYDNLQVWDSDPRDDVLDDLEDKTE